MLVFGNGSPFLLSSISRDKVYQNQENYVFNHLKILHAWTFFSIKDMKLAKVGKISQKISSNHFFIFFF